MLIARGADANVTDKIGLTPMMMAIHRAYTGSAFSGHPVPNYEVVVDALLAQTQPPLDLEIPSYSGQTILAYAAQRAPESTGVIRKLLARGANLYTEDRLGTTPLTAAASSGQVPALKALLSFVPSSEHKRLLEKKNSAGSTALIRATRTGQISMVRFLVEEIGVSINEVNVGDETALSVALARANAPRQPAGMKADYLAIANYLRSRGGALPTLPNPTQIRCDGPNSDPMDSEKITKIIDQCGLTQLDQLIPLFPKSHLSTYLLSYAPRGIQEGSASHPRVITMGKNGGVFMTFNGDPAHSGYDVLEMIEFKESPARFELKVIDQGVGRLRVSSANPSQCTGCHGQNPRPLWDNWYLWPGIFGGEMGAHHPLEKAKLQEFEAQRNSGRYRHLLGQSDSDHESKTLGLAFTNLRFKQYQMDFFVSDLMGDVITEQIASNAKLHPFRYAIMGALSCTRPIEDFLPPALNAAMPRTAASILQETRDLDVQEFEQRIARHARGLPGAPEGSYALEFLQEPRDQRTGQSFNVQRVAKLRYVIEGLGESMDWSTTLERSTRHYVLGGVKQLEAKLFSRVLSSAATDPRERLLRRLYDQRLSELPVSWPDWDGLFRSNDVRPFVHRDAEAVCDSLVELSLSSLSMLASGRAALEFR